MERMRTPLSDEHKQKLRKLVGPDGIIIGMERNREVDSKYLKFAENYKEL